MKYRFFETGKESVYKQYCSNTFFFQQTHPKKKDYATDSFPILCMRVKDLGAT